MLQELERRTGGKCTLAELPTAEWIGRNGGVYFFFEPGEYRSGSGNMPQSGSRRHPRDKGKSRHDAVEPTQAASRERYEHLGGNHRGFSCFANWSSQP